MKRLAITGAAGQIGSALAPLLRPDYRLRLVDLRAVEATPDDEAVQADLSDFAAAERALAGVHAVLHLAGNREPSATWSELRAPNIEGTYNVYEAARRGGANKVVLASSNHVMGMQQLESRWPIATDAAIRPDSLYAVSKASGEALARYYSDAFEMSMICLRIGWFTSNPNVRDLRSLWISPRDMAQLVRLCIETPRKFGIYNGTSNNRQQQWDLTSARSELGYAPQDDVDAIERDMSPESGYVDPRAGVLRALNEG